MNRRHLIALSALGPLGLRTAQAQDRDAEIVSQLLTMWSTQDWALAETFLSPDLVVLYPRSTTMPGRDAFIQRQASSTIYTMVELIDFKAINTAKDGDRILLLAEMRAVMFGGKELVVPIFAVLQVTDGMVTAIHYTLDVDVFNDQVQR